MRTIIRNSYTPKTGDYCNKIVVDEDTSTQYIFDCDGVYTTYTSKQQEGAPMFYVDSKVASATNEAKSYADQKDQQILAEAKQYTDEHGGGGGGGKDNLFYINVTDVDFSEGTFTADKTYAEILEAYNAGKLPIVIVKEEDSSYRYNGIYMLRSYGVNEESDGFDFAYANATGGEGRVEAGSWVIHIGNGHNRANESYGSVEIDNALSQYSNHAVKNSAVYEALSQKVSQADLATVATSGSYNDLSNKPTIPTVNNATLTIQKNGSTVGTFTANASSNATANITVPTKTSDVTNDSGFLTSSTLPIAGAGVLGAISVGAGLEISSGGVLSATGGGTADAVAWGHVTGTLADQTDLQTVLNGKQASLSTAQLDAANSGITSEKVSTYDGYASTIAGKANSADVPVITLTTTDPGEGATLAANTFIGVYNG